MSLIRQTCATSPPQSTRGNRLKMSTLSSAAAATTSLSLKRMLDLIGQTASSAPIESVAKKRARSDAEAADPKESAKRERRAGAPESLRRHVIYTDGSSIGNGAKTARAGAAIWGSDGALQWSGAVPGEQTNQRAELWAAIVASAYVRHRLSDGADKSAPVLVCSDSDYVVRGLNEPSRLALWARNGWRLKSDKPTANSDLWCLLHQLVTPRLVWRHVFAHTGIPGNESADKLALAAAKARAPGAPNIDTTTAWPTEFLGAPCPPLTKTN
jgi:ribonuclease HI